MHAQTPTVSVWDPRHLNVANVTYCRDAADGPIDARIYRQTYDGAARLSEIRDPRLHKLLESEPDARPNLKTVCSLTGFPLSSDSVDAGIRLTLPGAAGQSLFNWDGALTQTQTDFDLMMRPLRIVEHPQAAVPRNSVFFTYGDSSESSAAHNRGGQVVRHDDSVGTAFMADFTITGGPHACTRHFLAELNEPDWPATEADRDALHETGNGATSRFGYNALGEAISLEDAKGNLKQSGLTIAGQLQQVRLKRAGHAQFTVLLRDIQYSAANQILYQAAGNGLVSQNIYDPHNGHLQEIIAGLTGRPPLQHLFYRYDPVGNILSLEDKALHTRFFRNQKIEAVSTFTYDSLYQLLSATGFQQINTQNGPQDPVFSSPEDPAQLENYRQTFAYDSAGNLTTLVHSAASQSWTQRTVISRYSNRGLEQRLDGSLPGEDEIAAGFDDNGNRKTLQSGQTLRWNARRQLRHVDQVKRNNAANDSEYYIYDDAGQRLRKIRFIYANAVTHTHETRYLPELEIRQTPDETLQVISIQAGRCAVEVLHWSVGGPGVDQFHYSLSNHLGSSSLTLDQAGDVISAEQYFAYGGTSWWAGSDKVKASYKTRRYAGQQRDATGLYDYGQRYYAPWLMRWISPDPAGISDGLNLFLMVRGNPIRFVDQQGLAGVDTVKAAGATLAREFVSATIASAVQAAFIGFLSPASTAVTAIGAVSGAVTGGISGYAAANWAQSDMSSDAPTSWAPLAAKISGAALGAALGAAPSLLGILDPKGNTAAANQIGSAFGTLYRELTAQYFANVGPSNPSIGRVDALTGVASVITAGVAGGAAGYGASALFGSDDIGKSLQSIFSVSAAAGTGAAAASLVRGVRGTPAKSSNNDWPAVDPAKAFVGSSSRHFYLSMGQLANLAVSQIPGYGELSAHYQATVTRAVITAVGDTRSTFVTVATPGLSADLGQSYWDLEKNEVGAAVIRESVPTSSHGGYDPAATENLYMVSETTTRKRHYSRSQLNF